MLPKVGCFTWLAIKHRILTSDRLVRLSIASPFRCVLCGEEDESIDHLFVNCQFAYQCWMFILNKLKYFTPLPNKIWDIFQAWLIPYPNALFVGI